MRSKTLSSALVLAACLVPVSDLQALANRVFVSARGGNDANACDNVVAPCQTFAGAVTKLNPGGEAIVLDSGGYGPVTITQGVTIEAPSGVTAFIHPPSGDAITINAASNDVVILRGLVLNAGSGNGITVNTVGTLEVDGCLLSSFGQFGIAMLGPGNLTVTNTDVSHSFIGVEIENASGTVTASLDHCHLDDNAAGFRSKTTTPGVSTTTATNSTANNNSQFGWLSGAGFGSGVNVMNLEFCSGSGNFFSGAQGFSSNASSALRYSNCVFSNNGQFGVERGSTGTVETRTSNSLTGNGLAPTSGTITSFTQL